MKFIKTNIETIEKGMQNQTKIVSEFKEGAKVIWLGGKYTVYKVKSVRYDIGVCYTLENIHGIECGGRIRENELCELSEDNLFAFTDIDESEYNKYLVW